MGVKNTQNKFTYNEAASRVEEEHLSLPNMLYFILSDSVYCSRVFVFTHGKVKMYFIIFFLYFEWIFFLIKFIIQHKRNKYV